MKKMTQDYIKKSAADIRKEVSELRTTIGKLQLERKVSPQKDVNTIAKNKKKIAVLLTILSSKNEA